ncbi:hypothetical protein Q7689_18175, partial [Nocardiopsis tropica]|nr:hypothetical protein [Nocardiopsis tropica]
MTVTVIIIIAVIVVLAVLVLLLLGMRALSVGSREDDYDDEYEYDDTEDSGRDPDRAQERDLPEDRGDEEPAPRGRSRRGHQDGGGRSERRPKGRRKREVDWDDDGDADGLSDNDFWSSLSEDGPAQRSSEPRGRRGDREERSPSVTAYEYEEDDYDDGYEDFEEETGPPGATTILPAATGAGGPSADLAMLASLGQEQASPQPDEPAGRSGR